ncbi:hypothetical protein AVO45_17250 [Ruegeria marisrubri]|uniref:Uncharacterized protein n=1 Tax=Ruegeria marisrubri TaxID=1685379 RepID=A0A0X3UBK9_9RHOB|nr:hypothetical protein [Ruegeria marisrubri]KUJ85249.1 hypothetical protein AVO45_17250 [Ruegeria marisrubri]
MLVNMALAIVLIGLPAAVGAHLVANPNNKRDTTAGATLIGFAAVVATVFALINPQGKLVSGALWLKMPGAFVAGVVIGTFTGWLKRSKGK